MLLSLRCISAAVAIAFAFAACGDSGPPVAGDEPPAPSASPAPAAPATPDAEPSPEPLPLLALRPSLHVYGDVPRTERVFIRETVKRAAKWMKMRRPKGKWGTAMVVNVWGYQTSDDTDVCGHVGVTGDIKLLLASECWAPLSPEDRTKVLVHEMFHSLQEDLVSSLDRVPAWLIEGSAEYAGVRALDEWGMRPYEEERSRHIRDAAAVSQPLRGLTKAPDWYRADHYGRHYSLAFLAVEHLVQGGSWKKPAFFLRDIATADVADWRRSFKRVFGISVNRFYKSFEEFRASGYVR